jgi:nitrite reductase (cytochrome c-552)
VVLVVVTCALTAGTLALLGNINKHKREGEQVVFKLVDIDETTTDPAEWGKNFPRQYDSYKRTVDVQRTRYGGSEAFQKVDEFPVWRTLFAGYAFSFDYRE